MPPAPATPLSAISRPRTQETAPTTPQPHVHRVELAPLTTCETFVSAHRAAHSQRENYLHPGYRRRPSLDRATRADLQPRNAFLLPANNMFARISYAQLMGEHLERHALALPPEQPMFFVTLINRVHTVPRRAAHRFKVRSLIGWSHEILRGASYVGMVEGAYFSNLRTLGGPGRRFVSWHTHLVLWERTEAEVAALCKTINARHITAIPGRVAAHYRPLQLEEVFGQGLYMSKGQINEYRVWPKSQKLRHPATGEVFRRPSGGWEVKKRPLRPADAIHLCQAFAGRHIDDLAFAAGEGREVLRSLNRAALAEFDHWEAGQPYKLAEARRWRAR